ncbi:unnamed protein product [Brassicogethes aeneus]|uniref:Uncharacterized protein n=1 Tax=Brassicogethes aeneus TaxID=1431903 RepID=A0A9P0FGP7_BRAAE|nr:unnamed protein product [Brassicogethes aeneus]
MGSEHYCLRWNNHQSNLLGVFSQLLRDESLVDVTLACSEGHSIRAHKVVLSACSSYFQTLFVDHPSRHPIVILKDVRFAELRTLIDFMYKGEVNVEYCQLSALLKTAESLKVKGLAEMTRDYKQEPEQTEPKELVGRRPASSGLQPVHNQLPRPATPLEDMDGGQNSPASSVQNLRVCKSPSERERERDRDRDSLSGKRPPSAEDTSSAECGPSDLVIHNNSTTVSVTGTGSGSVCLPQPPLRTEVSNPTAVICHRPSSPLNCEPLPGPSNMPPVQQVPLSLKKEVDWGGGEEKNSGETSSDYSRHPHDSDQAREGSPRLFPCMYCGNSFPHQSKLTRHILSHSLETLKYREQRPHQSQVAMQEQVPFIDFSSRIPAPPHDPPDPTDQPPTTPMDLDLGDAGIGGSGGVVLCKFCGKSFPDVSSLITHLPVHTGDRPFKCEFCGKAFKLRHHMKDHCRVHTGERPFRCGLCGKTFSRSTILKAHEKTHYPKYVRKFLSPTSLDTEESDTH